MSERLSLIDKVTMTLVNNFASSRCKSRILDLLLGIKEKTILDALNEGYLVDKGWFNALEKQASVGANNEPIPWITYPAIDFLSGRLRPGMSIFEFGSGNSTYYYAARVASVTAVEHDSSWYQKLKNGIPDNVTLIFKELAYDESYCRAAMLEGKKYDIVIVDGRDRVNCLKNSIYALNNGGVVILDDSERDEYTEGKEFMSASGFKQIDFNGISPGNLLSSCTTFFYMNNNCLGL